MIYEYPEEMEACPFCGYRGAIQHIEFDDGDTYYSPCCDKFECCEWQINFPTKQEAIEAWNKRKSSISLIEKHGEVTCNGNHAN